MNQIFTSRTGQEFAPGSNAWVLSGKRTPTGKPILANDPHSELQLPFHLVYDASAGAGLNVEGASLPGFPA